jgi:hypothetical protein
MIRKAITFVDHVVDIAGELSARRGDDSRMTPKPFETSTRRAIPAHLRRVSLVVKCYQRTAEMGMPVKLSDALVKVARVEAGAADRSITAQIEHWASLGRAVETALRHEDALALKHAGGDLHRAFRGASARKALLSVLRRIAAIADRSELAGMLMHDRTVYQADPKGSGAIERIEPDGTRTAGRLEHRRFVPVRPARRRVHR